VDLLHLVLRVSGLRLLILDGFGGLAVLNGGWIVVCELWVVNEEHLVFEALVCGFVTLEVGNETAAGVNIFYSNTLLTHLLK
jgi:hypothetical protein